MLAFRTGRTEFINEAVPGPESARELSRMTDEAVSAIARAASSGMTGRWAVVATGGWGSGRLQPTSDLDLLILTEKADRASATFVQAVLYPLWDTGLAIGHQVRTPREQLRAVRDDVATCTAALTARVIAGDAEWADAVLTSCASGAHSRRRSLLRELSSRPRPGSPYALEPDLKNGAGGQRDIDELVWIAATLTARTSHGIDGLATAGLLSCSEVDGLEHAASVLSTARWEMGRVGRGPLLSIDSAQDLTVVTADEVQRALARIAHALEHVRERLVSRSSATQIGQGHLSATALFALLERGNDALPELEAAAFLGRLDHIAEGMSRLMTTRRPGLGHRYTVGAHSLRAACSVAEISRTAGSVSESARSLGDLRPLRIAALVHDTGKAVEGPGHAERGTEPARLSATRAGLSVDDAALVADAVRLHLLLAETSQRADLDDEDVILRCARLVSTPRMLAALHVLTVADSQATGPTAWTPWTAALLNTLVSRLSTALSENSESMRVVDLGEAVRAQALAAVGDSSSRQAFIEAAPLRYLASRSAEEVVQQSALVASLSSARGGSDILMSVKPGPADQTYRVTVATVDRPALLSSLAGACALSGLDILSVDAYGVVGGIALDAFTVTSATEAAVTTETIARLERTMVVAIRDRHGLASRLSERRRHYPPRSTAPTVVKTTPHGWDTELRVTAADRPGLLHEIARAVSDCELNITWAAIQTIDGVARDTFRITGPDGGPVTDHGVLGHLSMRIRDVI